MSAVEGVKDEVGRGGTRVGVGVRVGDNDAVAEGEKGVACGFVGSTSCLVGTVVGVGGLLQPTSKIARVANITGSRWIGQKFTRIDRLVMAVSSN